MQNKMLSTSTKITGRTIIAKKLNQPIKKHI